MIPAGGTVVAPWVTQMLEPSELFPEVPNLYEFPSVHAGMLFDRERVAKYRDAIFKAVQPGDIVADIGTGTGLLAFFSLQAGAKRVHAIERSAAIRWARRLARDNGFADSIVFHQDDSRDVEIGERVDVIVSELIGHIAFEEGMVESLVDARRRFLRQGGSVLPLKVALRAALVSEQQVYRQCIDCWGTIHGINYSQLRDEAVNACYLTSFRDRDLLSNPTTFFSVDFDKPVRKQVLGGTRSFETCRSGKLNGVALWFDAELVPGIGLSSGPWTETHWQQCFVPIDEPLNVEANERIAVSLEMHLRRSRDAAFELKVQIKRE